MLLLLFTFPTVRGEPPKATASGPRPSGSAVPLKPR
jgi:hypothetical protein